jgi:hypothetical protein
MKRFIASVPGIVCLLGIIALIARGFGIPLSVRNENDIKLIVGIIISFVVLAAGLWVILSKKYEADVKKWAFGAVGFIIGYWLRTG